MVASPKLSQWFYLYEQRNRPLRLEDLRHRPTAPAPPRRRGFAPGNPQKRFTEPQRQTIIDLIKSHPRSPSTVAEEFAKAWPGLTVTKVTIHKLKREVVKLGALQPA